MKDTIKKIISYIDARDYFCLFGLVLLFVGLTGRFDVYTAMIVAGAIILIKGLVKWA